MASTQNTRDRLPVQHDLVEANRRIAEATNDINHDGCSFVNQVEYAAKSLVGSHQLLVTHNEIMHELLERVSRLESDVARLETELNLH